MNDTSMLLRIAKAINAPLLISSPCDYTAGQLIDMVWDRTSERDRQYRIAQARAVLTEMREPTIAMILSCADLDGSQQDYWHRSIDRALSDKDM